MSQKGLAPITIILLIAVLIGGYLLYSERVNLSQTKQALTTEEPVISTESFETTKGCPEIPKDKIFLEKKGNKTFFNDLINGYQFDVSVLPEIKIEEKICVDEGKDIKYEYEVDMYKFRSIGNNLPQGVARFSVDPPISNDPKLTLEDYAKQKLRYVEGKHIDSEGTNYRMPYVSSPILKSDNNGIKQISWEDIYTDYPTHREGTTAAKHYLLEVTGKIIYFQVFSWDIPSFKKATQDFDKVIYTFKFQQS